MKLRIRSTSGGPTFRLQIPSPCTLQALRAALGSCISASSFRISLNKKDEILGPEDTLLTAFGIRSGDLLFYLDDAGTKSLSGGDVGSGSGCGEIRGGVSRDAVEVESGTRGTRPGDGDGACKDGTGEWDSASVRRDRCASAAMRRAFSLGGTYDRKEEGVEKAEETLLSPVGNVSAFVAGPSTEGDANFGLCEPKQGEENVDMDTAMGYPSEEALDADESSIETSCKGCSSIPVQFRRVLLAEDGNCRDPHSFVILGIHAVMLETGFALIDLEKQALLEGSGLPPGWSTQGTLSLCYTLPEIRSFPPAAGVGSIILKCHILQNSVVVYGTTIDGSCSQIYRLCLQTSKYLSRERLYSSSNQGNPGRETFEMGNDSCGQPAVFMDAFSFWRVVKDSLSIPLLTVLCERAGLPVPTSLLVLPTELKMKILESLSAVELARAGCACSELRHLSANDQLWKQMFMKEFGWAESEGVPCGRNWKRAFQQRWMERKRRMVLRRRYPLFPTPVHRFRFPLCLGSPQFGITGGDYDRFPAIGGVGYRGGFGRCQRAPFGGAFRAVGGARSETSCDFGGFPGGFENRTDPTDCFSGLTPNLKCEMGAGSVSEDYFG